MSGFYLEELISFYNAWRRNQEVPIDFLLMRYEDIIDNPHRELKRVTDFLGFQVSDDILAEAVRYASFEKMRKREEKSNKQPSDEREPLTDAESKKARKGKVGGFQEYLSTEEILFIEKNLSARLDPYYGYNYFSVEQ